MAAGIARIAQGNQRVVARWWRMSPLLAGLDRLTRGFWKVSGRKVDLTGSEEWLSAPMHQGSRVGDAWLQDAAAIHRGTVVEKAIGGGLLKDMSQLDGPHFRAADLRAEVRDFYEHTSDWRMEVWAAWNPVFQPGGELVARLFGRRVQQLALPTRALDVALGMDSRIAVITGADGEQRATAWLRTLRSTGEYVYSGCYSTRTLPGGSQPSVHVAFPLESGNVQVFLRPRVLPDGGLGLLSPPGRFGEDGAYVVVDAGGTHASRVPIHEAFRVYVDGEGVLRTDHALRLWRTTAVRLHYKLSRADKGDGEPVPAL